mgnify:CR=1 FL=1
MTAFMDCSDQIGRANPLYENLTAYENLKVRVLLYNTHQGRMEEVLELVELTDTGKKKAGQFSME